MTWTFDPLVRRNAYFNLVKLGATAVAFHQDFYGSMQDEVNAGDLSDRILIEWDLDSPRALDASVAALPSPSTSRPSTGDGPWCGCPSVPDGVPEVATGGAPSNSFRSPTTSSPCATPTPSLARRWRLALRETLGAALEEGDHADGITRDGWYVVRRSTDD